MTGATTMGGVRLDCLLELLSDKDEVTQRIVRSKVLELGWDAVVYFYDNIDRVIPEELRTDVRRNVRETSVLMAVCQLTDLMKSGTELYLPDCLYYLTRIVQPELRPEEFRSAYEGIGNDLMCELRDGMTAVEKVEMLNCIMFDMHGFCLNRTGRDGAEHPISLTELLKCRKGGAVGLSIVYFLLAAYAGLPVYPVFPRSPGYYVSYMEEGRSLFTVDVGGGGRITDPVPAETMHRLRRSGDGRGVVYIYATALRHYCRGLSKSEVTALEGVALMAGIRSIP